MHKRRACGWIIAYAPRCIRIPNSRMRDIGIPGIVVSIALPSMCWEYFATARERARNIALV